VRRKFGGGVLGDCLIVEKKEKKQEEVPETISILEDFVFQSLYILFYQIY